MTERRDFIKFMAAAPMAHLAVTALDLEEAAIHTRETLEKLAERGQQYQPKVFSAHEWSTVRVLVDLVIPRDARSGSGDVEPTTRLPRQARGPNLNVWRAHPGTRPGW